MLVLNLSKLRFYARHGLYKEEEILGGEFEVNAMLWHEEKSNNLKFINDVIDYTNVYSLIKEKMQNPTPLLETLVISISEAILRKFSQAEEVEISITKIHPPIIAFGGSVTLSYHLKRNN